MKNQVEDVAGKPNRECNAVVIYEDKATETRARCMLQAIFGEMGPDIPYVVTAMTVAQMTGMTVCEGAATLDFVIISVHDAVRCISRGGWWLTRWLNEISPMPRALFLLHDGEAESGWVRGLRAFAESAGVSLFSRSRLTAEAIPVRSSASQRRLDLVEA